MFCAPIESDLCEWDMELIQDEVRITNFFYPGKDSAHKLQDFPVHSFVGIS